MTSMSSLTVITGPSGVGKGSLVKKLLQKNKQVWLSISATTRSPREGEVNGSDYFFLKPAQFKDLIKKGLFLEWAEFAGNFYGTPKDMINEKISKGQKVLLEIELEGARQIRLSCPDSFHIFVAPPSIKELESRIRGRATDSEDAILKRLNKAQEEISAQNEFDAVVINDDLDLALIQIEKLMKL